MIKRTSGKFSKLFGQMIKGISSYLLKEDELSDTQNMQPGFQWKQRKGQGELTTSAVASNLGFKSLFQFTQLNEGGNYILAHTYDASNGERIMRASELPPDSSPTTWSEDQALTAGCSVTQFAQVQDAVIAANNKEFLIWRGEEHRPTGVYFYDDGTGNYINWYDECTDGDASSVMSLSSMTTSDEIYVLADQPLNKITFTMATVNGNASAMTVKKYNGSWTSLSIADGTETGGNTSLGQSGAVTWTVATDEIKTFIEGLPGFAYQITFDAALDSDVTVSAITVHSPWNNLKNIWDGQYIGCQGCKVSTDGGTTYEDYTAQVNSISTVDAANFGGVDLSNYIYVGFSQPVSHIILSINDDKNTNTSPISAIHYFKDTGAWTSVGTFTDTTNTGSTSYAQSGYLAWDSPTDEKPVVIGQDLLALYWYRLYNATGTTSDPTGVYYIEGVPAAEDPAYCYGVVGWKRRAWQLAPRGAANAMRYSASSLPNTFNGADSGYIYFGERPLRRALPFFNELVIWADREMWMLQGDSPSSYGRMRMSATVGIDAPMSAVSIETGVRDSQGKYKVTLAWFFQGIWMFDGIKWWLISAPDIDNFFNPNHADYINPDYADKTYGEYDPETQCAHWIIYSGAGQTTPNKIIALHVPTMWYGIYSYGTDISCILSAFNKRFYLVAGGHASGKYYRLNYGDQDVNAQGVAVAIDAFMITADMWAAYEEGVKQRVFSLVVESQVGGMIELDEYPDASKTAQPAGKVKQTELGKTKADVQWRLKEWEGQQTAKFRIRHRSLNRPFIPYGYTTNWDRDRSDL